MNTVQPIRDPQKLEQMKQVLRKRNEKYYMMFVLGINTGLRISDIRMLNVSDVYDRDHIIIREEKTGKEKRFLINAKLQNEIRAYVKQTGKQPDDYLITSQKGNNQPLSRVQAYHVLNEAAQECGIQDKIGTHTMRKTFGYWHYKRYHDVAILQDIFNHSSPSVTMRYIGINDDIKDQTLRDFYI